MKTIFYLFLFSLLLLINKNYAQGLSINEFMAFNISALQDPDFNAYSDWIEIFNAGQTSVNIKDYFITDDLNNPQKYRFTADLYIPAQGYLLVWADEMNTGTHTNFKLSTSGESIGLFNPASVLIDTLSYGLQLSDISEGRLPEGGLIWFKFFPSTPGTMNQESGIYNKLTAPAFSLNAGFYQTPLTLTLTHAEPEVIIYFTIDGSIPDQGSSEYVSPVSIDSTTAVRAVAFKSGYISSDPVVNTYIINFETDLPVFSLVTDPDNFFSDSSGIYVTGTNGITGHCSNVPRNWNQDWERPVSIEFFEKDKQLAFEVQAGVKIAGACSRIYPMKSLAVNFREEYGFDELNYRLFPDLSVLKYKNFVLRSSGQDWWRTMFRDGMVQTLIEQGMNVGYQEYRPALVFLNGQYWGIHNIRERINDEYLQYHYGVEEDNIDLVEISKGIFINNGDLTAYNSMIDFLSTQNMSLPANYDYIKSLADIDDYIDYLTAEIYSANADWPGSNVKLWRTRVPPGKFRWLVYDLDFTFGGNAQGQYTSNTLALATSPNGPAWPNPPWSTLMFRKLLDNSEFKNEFIQRFAVHMNTTFNPEYVNGVIDSLADIIEPEITRHKQRWPQSISLGEDWYVNVQIMKDFAFLRQPEVRNHFYQKFNLTGSYTLTISRNIPSWGKIYTHNVEVKQNGSANTFFKNIPLKVKASPSPGYRFLKWEGASASTISDIEIITSGNSYLKAVFEPADLSIITPVLNEINYKSSPSFDTEDWIEIYNPVENDIDISGWQLQDGNSQNTFIFPAGSEIKGNGYLVISRDTVKFKLLHFNIANLIGNINFGLSSSGDIIMLKNPMGELVDSVLYGVSGEWPSLPNGNGPTLSLINPQLDNTLSINWKASGLYGTPGRINDVYTKTDKEEIIGVNKVFLYNNYPNPFNNTTLIRWQIPNAAEVTVKVYDILGREIAVLIDGFRNAGEYTSEFNADALPSGIYFCQLKTDSHLDTKKMVLIK